MNHEKYITVKEYEYNELIERLNTLQKIVDNIDDDAKIELYFEQVPKLYVGSKYYCIVLNPSDSMRELVKVYEQNIKELDTRVDIIRSNYYKLREKYLKRISFIDWILGNYRENP